jgi:hypothetical protein
MWPVLVERKLHAELWWGDVKERDTLKYSGVDLREIEWKAINWISLGPDRGMNHQLL